MKAIPEKSYRFIVIGQDGDELFEGSPVYRIRNKRNRSQIGILSYYKPWKEYVFSSHDDCVFNDSCLRDVLDFMDQIKVGMKGWQCRMTTES